MTLSSVDAVGEKLNTKLIFPVKITATRLSQTTCTLEHKYYIRAYLVHIRAYNYMHIVGEYFKNNMLSIYVLHMVILQYYIEIK